MIESPDIVSIQILDKQYQVKCKADELPQLTKTAAYLDKELRKIRESGKVTGVDRMTTLVALNFAHEVLQLRAREAEFARVQQSLQVLQAKLDAAFILDELVIS